MNIQTRALGPLQTNCYIVSDDSRTDAVIIDPAGEPERIRAALGGNTAAAVLLTHGHFDHTGALSAFSGTPIYIHAADQAMLTDPRLSLAGMVRDRAERPAATDLVQEGSELNLAGLRIQVLHTPGHSLFTGDTMFQGSYGRTDFPGGSQHDLMRSLSRLLALPDDYPVYPGHGPATRLSYERCNYPGL